MTLGRTIFFVTQKAVSVNASKLLKVEPVIVVNSITMVSTLDEVVRYVTVIQRAPSTSHVMTSRADVTVNPGLRF